MSMTPICILIADDHTLFRDGLAALLANVADVDVAGQATDGEDVIAQASALTPDVILMDIQMPRVNGIEATRRILQAQPQIGIIMLTMLEDDDSLFAAMRAGARGYILKGADKAEMLKTIRAVAQGDALFGAGIARRLTDFFAGLEETHAAGPFPELTEREREILDLIAQGHNNAAIADRLNISSKTVSNNVSVIFSKLQVVDRAQAIIRAREAGLGRETS